MTDTFKPHTFVLKEDGKDGKTHLETYNGTGWAYNDNAISFYYLPKIS